MNRVAFVNIFKDIVDTNKAIQLTDPGTHHFGRLILSAAPFQHMDLTEFFAQKMKMQFPYLLLGSYDINYGDNGIDNRTKNLQCTFFILDKIKKEDFDARDTALDVCESIGDDIMGYLRNYFRVNPDNTAFELDGATSEAIGPVGDSFFGVRVDFNLIQAANAQTGINPAKWL